MRSKQAKQPNTFASDLQAAFDLLSEHVDLKQVDIDAPLASSAVYTNGLALWMMVLQRMAPNGSPESSVKQLLDSGSNLLPQNNKRVEEKNLSANTTTFSKVRKRVPLDRVYWLHDQVASSIISRYKPAPNAIRFFVIDGTTLSLTPNGELRKAFPPASNQYGLGV